mgnify:CR=1 FL=1
MDTRLNIALVGFGRFGKKYYKLLKKNQNFFLKAIYRKKKFNKNIFQKLSASSLRQNKIKAAIICTPIDTHFHLANFFIKKRIPIILEKPAAKNLSEIKKLIVLSKNYKSTVLINHSDLFNNNLNFLISSIKNIGKIEFIEAKFGKFNKSYKNKKFLPFNDWLPHPLAIILTIINKIEKIEMIKNDMNFKQKSIFQDLILSFQNKNKLNGKIYFSNKFKKKKRQVIIYGKKGLIHYNGYDFSNNFIKVKKKIYPTKKHSSPMQNLLEIFYRLVLKKRFRSDLKLSYEIEKILDKIKKK